MEPDLSIAVIADIHGNIWALDAVLADIDQRGITQIVDLGDTVYGPFAPRETAQRLRERRILSVRGNCDREIYEEQTDQSASLMYTRAQLVREDLDWLRTFPATLVVAGAILLCHGTPDADTTYLTEEPTLQGSCLRPIAAIEAALTGVAYPVICCAHSHIPRVIMTTTQQLIINPGSVGMPAYADGACPMEVGSPHARYAILHQRAGRWSVEQVVLHYDWSAAAEAARLHEQPDRAFMQMTGLVPR
ncbi:MAG: metallophosphoesterase family protein [Ktedonobacteraceae bacterium]|nr:metallophosphoesterase family protein [Ktedonobacteraceae bacterium]MBA3822483.1 metallophosphoesterase family protein [Ktedonobacterales bacterium]